MNAKYDLLDVLGIYASDIQTEAESYFNDFADAEGIVTDYDEEEGITIRLKPTEFTGAILISIQGGDSEDGNVDEVSVQIFSEETDDELFYGIAQANIKSIFTTAYNGLIVALDEDIDGDGEENINFWEDEDE